MPSPSSSPERLTAEAARHWLRQYASVKIPDGVPVEALRFSRYSSMNDGVVLLPDSCAHLFPNIGDVRSASIPASQSQREAYRPAKRVASDGLGRRDQLGLTVERVQCREVTLRCTPTRSSHWGIDLNRLKFSGGVSLSDFTSCLRINELEIDTLSADVMALLHGAYAVAAEAKAVAASKKMPKVSFHAPKLPVIHNQRDGIRYILSFDGRNMGSPDEIHVLLYPEGKKPSLNGWAATERPSAAERKPGLLLTATPDKRIRFYQATDEQWREWQAQRPALESLPETLRPIVAEALAAAERLRQTIA